METRLLPGPADEEPGGPHADTGSGGPRTGGPRGHRSSVPLPDAEACLRALAQLPGLIAIGLLKPAQANAIRATYQAILQQYRQSEARREGPAVANADLLELLRANPQLVSLLEPLLTDEQIAMVMQHVGGEDNES